MPTFTTNTTTQNNILTQTLDSVPYQPYHWVTDYLVVDSNNALGQINISEVNARLTREYVDRVFRTVLTDRPVSSNRNNFDDYGDEEDIISFEQILNNARTS